MNTVILLGRLTKDVEVRDAGNTKVGRFTLAVNRNFKNAEGKYDADFIKCIVFGKQAEFVEQYFRKGSQALVTGRIQTGKYTNKDGQNVYTTDVVISGIDFTESKNNTGNTSAGPTSKSSGPVSADGFMNIPDGIDESLPFN